MFVLQKNKKDISRMIMILVLQIEKIFKLL